MTTTIPYSIRIPKDLLEEMRRFYDRMDPPKPTFSAILSHLVKLGWEAYRTPVRAEPRLPEAVVPSISRGFSINRLQGKP
ncbi:MAG TPA: hypothetical protein VI816_04325 [Candidatus Bathyarchaeia archaeon]|nr:hypothetical protein [Candidatus Bathyarchaeia archaeon]